MHTIKNTDTGLSVNAYIFESKKRIAVMEDMSPIDKLFADLESTNDTIRYPAFIELEAMTRQVVPWVYDKWFVLKEKLSSDNSFQRNIGLKLLVNLSKSDTENRMGNLLDQYLDHFEDEKFITARQCIQNVWKIALQHTLYRKKIIQRLEISYNNNIHLKRHANLIRQDIIGSLTEIYRQKREKEFLQKIRELVDSETDEKNSKSLKKIMHRLT